MSVPSSIRTPIKDLLWEIADKSNWNGMSLPDKAKMYERWTRDPEIGGVLRNYMDVGQIRVYIKDTLLKGYSRSTLSDPRRPLQALGIGDDVAFVDEYIKPHGRRLSDGRIVCWGRAEDWKTVLLAVHERAHLHGAMPFAAALLQTAGRFAEQHTQDIVQDAANKLQIKRLLWMK
jgi:hypothetical protein